MSETTLFASPFENSANGYAKPRRRTWGAIIGLTVIAVLTVTAILLTPSGTTYSALEMHGGPVVMNATEQPEIIALTSHWESQRGTSGRYAPSSMITTYLHYDVWAFNAKDLSRKWMTRIATIKRGRRSLDEGILGVDHGVVWLIADELTALDANDGHVIADAAKLEKQNSALQGAMPTSRKQILFDNGLVLIAADGKRWRINSQTMAAVAESDVASNVLRGSADGFYRPMHVSWQTHLYKTRSYVVGDTWYGLMHPSELAMFEKRDPYTQAFGRALRYKLWAAPLHDTISRFRDPIREAHNWKPQPNSEEYLEGGLLAIPDSSGKDRVVGIAKPIRFLVIHQDRVDEKAQQTLSCVGLDGRTCWNAPLNMIQLSGFERLTSGGPADWALIVVGVSNREHENEDNDAERTSFPAFDRVSINDGKVQRLSFESIDLRELSKTLKPYRKR